MKKFNLFWIAGLALVVINGCGNGAQNENNDGSDEVMEEVEHVMEDDANDDGKVVYYSTPSLVEVAAIMKSSGASFNGDILNSIDNTKRYTTQEKRALNLGVYGADLTYSALFENTQESINYLKTIKQMADDMGMTGAFEADLLNQIESNITNRDSLLNIITEFYWSADAYLTDNERAHTASLIIAGGWIESMHIACDMATNSPNNGDIKTRIGEQKLILKNLVLLLKSQHADDEHKGVVTQFEELQMIYDKIGMESETGEVVADAEAQHTEIGNTTELSLTDEIFTELTSKFEEIRSEYVN